MKESRLLQVIGNIDEKYILEMEDIVCSMHKVTTHKPIKKAWLIAAVVAIMVLLMGSTLLIPLVQPECPVMDLPLVQGSQIAHFHGYSLFHRQYQTWGAVHLHSDPAAIHIGKED